MAADSLEKLQILGSYGLRAGKSYPVNDFYNRDGYGFSVTNGDSRGLRTWQLTYDFLADDSTCVVTLPDHLGGGEQTYFQYYTRFFDRHHEPVLRPFIITCPETGVDFTVVFGQHNRDLVYDTFKMWQTGILLVQFRPQDEAFFAPGLSAPTDTI